MQPGPGRASLARRLTSPLWGIYGFTRAAPWWMKSLIGLSLLAVLVISVMGLQRWQRSRQNERMQEAWRKFDEGAKTGNREAMDAALETVLLLDPNDELARIRQEALRTGAASQNDQPMIYLTMKQNLRENKLDDAAREADKWLNFRPKDWMAHCIKSLAALQKGDRATALKWLEQLPTPDDVNAGVEPGGLLLAFRLFRALDRDAQPLQYFVHNNVTPAIKTTTVLQLPPIDRGTMLECYLEGFAPISRKAQPGAMLESFGAALKLFLVTTEDATALPEPAAAMRLGRLAPAMVNAVAAFRMADQITPEQAKDFRQELEASAQKLWAFVLEKDPKQADAYVGLAQSWIRSQDYAKARETVAKGLQACGDQPDLSQLFSRMLQLEGQARQAYEALVATARKYPDQPIWWGLAADAGIAAGRRDLALKACAELRTLDPKNRWAIRTEARLWLDAGDPNKAAQLLFAQGLESIAKDAEATQIYARALGQAGLSTQLTPFLEACEQVSIRLETPAPMAAALRGWAESKPGPSVLPELIQAVRRAIGRWPEAIELNRVEAIAVAQAAEQTLPAWDRQRVEEAILTIRRFQVRRPNDRDMAVLLARLRLFGENNPEVAYQELGPIRDLESTAELTVPELELLGTIYRRLQKFSDAQRVLERANQQDPTHAGLWIELALTYHGQERTAEAQQALGRARALPRTAQQQSDYVEAIMLIQGGKR